LQAKAYSGVFAAPMSPMRDDQSIDEAALGAYLEWLLSHPGFSGFVMNVHAGEGTFIEQEDRLKVLRTARSVVPAHMKVIAGACGNSTVEMIRQVKSFEDAGADAAIIIAVRDWQNSRAPGHAERFYEAIGRATSLPLVVFQSPSALYDTATLTRILEVPSVVAVKQAVQDVALYHEQLLAIRAKRPDVAVLSAYDAALFPTLAIGADGVLLGIAGLLPKLIISIFEAMKRDDFNEGRRLCEELGPIAHFLYGRAPRSLRHVRSKAALKEFGIIPSAMVREPLLPLDKQEKDLLLKVLESSGLTGGARSKAA
jgi:4-hydroxy-tetrahydrodipicolinate synthase